MTQYIYDEPWQPPAFDFLDSEEKETSLNAFKGKVIVLNLWATWCKPCVEELPDLQNLNNHFQPDKARVVAISLDFSGIKKVEAFLQKINVTDLPVYHGGMDIISRFGARGVPTTYIINPEGHVAASVSGVIKWDHPDVIAYIASLLESAS